LDEPIRNDQIVSELENIKSKFSSFSQNLAARNNIENEQIGIKNFIIKLLGRIDGAKVDEFIRHFKIMMEYEEKKHILQRKRYFWSNFRFFFQKFGLQFRFFF